MNYSDYNPLEENSTRSGAYHLAGDKNAYQPVRTNNFRFQADFKKILKNSGTNDITFDLPNGSAMTSNTAQEILDFSVVSFQPPHFSQDEISIKRGNSTIYFAGAPTFETKELKINDLVGADGKSVLMFWQSCSYDVINDIIPSSDNYKIDATVYELTSDNRVVRTWKLEGCWIRSLSEEGWDNESVSKKTVTATIRYDRAYLDYEEKA